jgi:hypothetical protein
MDGREPTKSGGEGADPATPHTIETLRWDNSQLRALPVSAKTDQLTTPQPSVPDACFSLARPTALARPRLVVACRSALALLGLRPDEVERPDFAEFFCGNRLLPGAEPAAHCCKSPRIEPGHIPRTEPFRTPARHLTSLSHLDPTAQTVATSSATSRASSATAPPCT